MIEVTSRWTGTPPALATLVRGDVRELGVIEAAVRLAEPMHAALVAAVLPGRPRAGLELLRALTEGTVGRWYGWSELARQVSRGGVRGLLISAETWRGAPRAVWTALLRCPLLIQRRRPPDLPRRVLVAVDSRATLAALAGVVERLPGQPGLSVTMAYATVPAWAWSVTAALGCPVIDLRTRADEFPWPLAPWASGICVQATPLWGIQSLVRELRPDLVVLGLHPHRLRLPSLAHPTAWPLSRELPTDVLLWPVG